MITDIFYSLVLFSGLRYNNNLKSGFFLDYIEEGGKGIMICFFSNNIQKEKIIFQHKDFINNKSIGVLLKTKNWFIYGKNIDLLKDVFKIIFKSDKNDFNFFKEKSFYNKVPFGVVLNITTKCNLFCKYCFNSYDYSLNIRNSIKTLGLDDFKLIIDKLYNEGTRDIILTGGEPFVCEFLWDLLDYLKEKNIFVRINSNGTLLSKSVLKKLNEQYSLILMISIHEFNNIDFYNTNKKGAEDNSKTSNLKLLYSKKMLDLKKIKKYNNLRLDFMTILTSKNILYLEKIYEYVLNNFSIKNWHFFRLFPTGTTKGISRGLISLAIHKIYKLNKKYNTNFKIVDSVPFCVIKDTFIASKVIDGELSQDHNIKTIITANGDIQMMCAFDKSLGNIFEKSMSKIWNSNFVEKMLSNGFLPKECSDCLYKDKCMGGNRMSGNMFNGSYSGLDPLCNLNNKKVF